MSAVLEFLTEAIDEAEESTRFYERQASGLGVRFRQVIESACVAIVRQPLLWRERRGGFRRINLPGFPFYIAYVIRDERILVAAVAHSSRHPDYWKRRNLKNESLRDG